MEPISPEQGLRFCAACGGGVAAANKICPRCGQQLAPGVGARATPVSPEPSASPTEYFAAPQRHSDVPPAAAGGGSWQLPRGFPATSGGLGDKLVLPSLDANKLLGGDWPGAAAAAAAGLGTAGGLSALLLLAAGITRLPGGLAVTLVVMLAGAAFGSDGVFAARGADVHTSVGVYPLTMTAISLAVIAVVFWRRIRSRRPSLREALAQAARTGLVFALALGVITLVVRAHLDGTGFATAVLPTSSTVHGSTPGAVVGGFLLCTLVCLIACLRKREWLPRRVLVARDLVAAPTAGLVAVLVTATVLAAVGLVVVGIVTSDGPSSPASNVAGQGSGGAQDIAAGLVVLALALPTIALYGLYLGVGAAFGTSGAGALNGAFGSTAAGSADVHYRVTSLADSNSWWWLTSVGSIISLFVGALVVAYLSGSLERARRTLLAFLGLLVVVTPLLTHLSAGYGQVHALGADGGGRFGISTPGAMLAIAVVGLIVVLVASAVAPSLFSRPARAEAPPGPATFRPEPGQPGASQ